MLKLEQKRRYYPWLKLKMKLIEKAKLFFKDFMDWVGRQNEPVAPLQWFLVLAVMIAIRTLMIFGSQGLPDRPIFMVATFYVQDLFFFLDALLLAWIWLTLFLKVTPQKLSRLMLWGTWLVIIPPIIDLVFYKTIFWSFYLFNDIQGLWMQYYSFFGHLPPAIVYFGSRIACALAVIATSVFVYYQTKKLWKALVNGWVVYSIFFLMGSFPSWLSYGYYFFAKGKSILAVTIADVAGLIASPVELFGIKHYEIGWMTMIKMNLVYFLFSIILLLVLTHLSGKEKNKNIFSGFFATSSFYLHLSMFLFGFVILGFGMYPQNFSPNFFAWITFLILLVSIGAGLLADELLLDDKGKRETNKIVFFNIIALGAFFVVGIKFFLLALTYRSLFVLIRENQFGLEKIGLTKYFLQWIALVLSVLFGFMLMSPDQAVDQFPVKIALWLTLGLLTVFGLDKNKNEKNVGETADFLSETSKKMALEALIFLIFIAGSFVMHKSGLFGWAIILGSVSFWAIEKEYRQKKWLIRSLFLIFLCLGLIIL